MPRLSYGYYHAIPVGHHQWLIMRGRFIMSRFTGSKTAAIAELQVWQNIAENPNGVTPMNAARRTSLAKIASDLRSCASELESIRDEEQEAFDNLPESLQSSDKGTAMEEAVANLEEAISLAENAADTIDSI